MNKYQEKIIKERLDKIEERFWEEGGHGYDCPSYYYDGEGVERSVSTSLEKEISNAYAEGVSDGIDFGYKHALIQNGKGMWLPRTKTPKYKGWYPTIVKHPGGYYYRRLVEFDPDRYPKWANPIMAWCYLPEMPDEYKYKKTEE